MQPSWVRPAYLYLLSLVGVVVMAIGAVIFLLGIVHSVSPDLQRQGDPVFRAADVLLDIAEVVVIESGEELPPGVEEALDDARAELDSQARHSGINQLITGLIVFLVGALVFGFHWVRAERGSRWAQEPPPPPPREGVLGP